jgi:uncharacterized protein (DUF2252 family)
MATVSARRESKTGHAFSGRQRLGESYVPWQERWRVGKALRERVPREEHAGWTPPKSRPNPIELVIKSDATRIPRLVPVRYGRMLTSPFAYLRGSANVMAWDLSRTPKTGIRVQAAGDCHLMNFGGFATPERRLIFDINDFDETLPAPWEWDVKRLAASFAVAGGYLGLRRGEARSASEAAVRSYRRSMAGYARLGVLEVWYDYEDVEKMLRSLPIRWKKQWRAEIAKERAQGPIEHEFPKLARVKGGNVRIRDNPPLVYHARDVDSREFHEAVTQAHFDYLKSVRPHHRVVIERYKLRDVAMKVVGVGSVGTFCAVALLMASPDDPLFLQIKQANASTLEPYAGPSEYKNHGERVVVGQRFVQAASDMLLGWGHGRTIGHDFYVRQLRDMKMSIDLETMDYEALQYYAKLCGHVLARAHARSGDAAVIAGYMGKGTVFDEAIADFAMDYSAQTDRDHKALADAVREGRIRAVSE